MFDSVHIIVGQGREVQELVGQGSEVQELFSFIMVRVGSGHHHDDKNIVFVLEQNKGITVRY